MVRRAGGGEYPQDMLGLLSCFAGDPSSSPKGSQSSEFQGDSCAQSASKSIQETGVPVPSEYLNGNQDGTAFEGL